MLFYCLPQHQSVSLRFCFFHIKLEGGMKIKISVVLVGPSVEKRKMFHVYYYTDISLVVGLYDLRLDQLWIDPSVFSAQDTAQPAAAPSVPVPQKKSREGTRWGFTQNLCPEKSLHKALSLFSVNERLSKLLSSDNRNCIYFNGLLDTFNCLWHLILVFFLWFRFFLGGCHLAHTGLYLLSTWIISMYYLPYLPDIGNSNQKRFLLPK